jgi:hypothetical protein
MNKVNARPKKPGIKLDDPDWEDKLKAIVEEKLAHGDF